MAETTSLLNWRTEQSVPGVRIPLSPHEGMGVGVSVSVVGQENEQGGEPGDEGNTR